MDKIKSLLLTGEEKNFRLAVSLMQSNGLNTVQIIEKLADLICDNNNYKAGEDYCVHRKDALSDELLEFRGSLSELNLGLFKVRITRNIPSTELSSRFTRMSVDPINRFVDFKSYSRDISIKLDKPIYASDCLKKSIRSILEHHSLCIKISDFKSQWDTIIELTKTRINRIKHPCSLFINEHKDIFTNAIKEMRTGGLTDTDIVYELIEYIEDIRCYREDFGDYYTMELYFGYFNIGVEFGIHYDRYEIETQIYTLTLICPAWHKTKEYIGGGDRDKWYLEKWHLAFVDLKGDINDITLRKNLLEILETIK